MLSYQKTINLNGTSSVEVKDTKVPYVYFSANIQPDGKTNVTYAVQDLTLFEANQDVFTADRAEFETAVNAAAASI